MGAGTYLKDGYDTSNGWKIIKQDIGETISDSVYISLAKKNIFEVV